MPPCPNLYTVFLEILGMQCFSTSTQLYLWFPNEQIHTFMYVNSDTKETSLTFNLKNELNSSKRGF